MSLKIFFITAIIVLALFSFVSAANGQAVPEKTALISQIRYQIEQLKAQLNILLAQNSGCFTFSKNLGFINSGENDVAVLHKILDSESILYAPDKENEYGKATAIAVSELQKRYGIYATGYFGKLTRSKLNAMCAAKNAEQAPSGSGASMSPVITTAPVYSVKASTINTGHLNITSPNGGEQWQTGSTHNITWTASGTNKLRIDLINDLNTWPIDSDASPASGSLSWAISRSIPVGTGYKIHIYDKMAGTPFDYSDNSFIIQGSSCADSDSGKNYNAKGTTTNSLGDSLTDYCVSDFSAINLIEGYCGSNGEVANIGYLCTFGCSNGICNPAPESYVLTTAILPIYDAGSISRSPAQSSYYSGSSVTLTANPAKGYKFSSWSGDITGTTNPVVFTMDGSKSITANFTEQPITSGYTITATTNSISCGSILPSGQVTVSAGGQQNFSISRGPDCLLSDVKVDGLTVGLVPDYGYTYLFKNVQSNHTIEADFVPTDTVQEDPVAQLRNKLQYLLSALLQMLKK